MLANTILLYTKTFTHSRIHTDKYTNAHTHTQTQTHTRTHTRAYILQYTALPAVTFRVPPGTETSLCFLMNTAEYCSEVRENRNKSTDEKMSENKEK